MCWLDVGHAALRRSIGWCIASLTKPLIFCRLAITTDLVIELAADSAIYCQEVSVFSRKRSERLSAFMGSSFVQITFSSSKRLPRFGLLVRQVCTVRPVL